jgi:antirestriction protein ArdC
MVEFSGGRSKATTIFFTKTFLVKDTREAGEEPDDEGKTAGMLRHYPMFHASQIEGIPPYVAPDVETAPWRRPEAADIILENSGAVVCIGGDRAFYSPGTDHIGLPPEGAFRGPPEWAACALHEIGHWTGHKSRLDRADGMKAATDQQPVRWKN